MDSADQKPQTQAGNGLVLHRMIAERERKHAPQQCAAAAAVEVSLERAAATALGRAAERLYKLPVYVEKVELSPVSLSELPELLPERALLAVVEAPRDRLGMMAICPALLTSLIEMQALGRLTTRKPVPRRATRTDATISADFVNLLLAELGRELGGRAGCPAFADFRYATYLDDPRPLALVLDDTPMARLSLRFRIGPTGKRDGHLTMALPVLAAAERAGATPATHALAPPGAATPAPPPEPVAPPDLTAAVQDAPIRLFGVLCRRSFSLGALRELGAGALLPLGPNVLDEARLETGSGQLVARGRLGEAEGYHAIRLARRTTGEADAPIPGTADDGLIGDIDHHDPFRPGAGVTALRA
ncbi:hypothetical protein GL279_17665 [Paracoccus limosus]|uniref:Flagellar motor switch protein FliN-like C-terminal domain-containing protein n=1 Tax=Paracoccus limosus TaxID=913252 RepID=A0A844H6N1_9RHOB|nr:FliM/FliN family flagellar motor C-terminal domain-containing protein [Paracoccus limosus]MTH36422.1 hypothetical protein [Paracoccus limosus]